jgi:hypothetical protein
LLRPARKRPYTDGSPEIGEVLIRHHTRRIHDRNAAKAAIASENNAEKMINAAHAPNTLFRGKEYRADHDI